MVDLAHAAFADLGGDFVGAEGGAELERHLVRWDEALEFLEPVEDDH